MFEGFGDVIWHINFNILLAVIPFHGQSTVVIPYKVHGCFVIFCIGVQ